MGEEYRTRSLNQSFFRKSSGIGSCGCPVRQQGTRLSPCVACTPLAARAEFPFMLGGGFRLVVPGRSRRQTRRRSFSTTWKARSRLLGAYFFSSSGSILRRRCVSKANITHRSNVSRLSTRANSSGVEILFNARK